MPEILKVGIAGYGVVGKKRRLFIDKHSHMKTVAVCDRSFSETPALQQDGIKYYSNYKELLREDLDVLFVCITNDMAPEVTLAGLQKDLHVFCEKPPGRDLNDIIQVVEASQKKPHLKVKYGFNHRYHGSIKEALQLIQSKELGSVINMRGIYGKSKMIAFNSDWRTKRAISGGGILLDQGIHMVDMMRLFGGEYSDVFSFISNGFWNHDVEDNAYALMRTQTGVVAMLHSSATQWKHCFNLEISLSKGLIVLAGILSGSKSYGEETITILRANDDISIDPLEKTTRYSVDSSWEEEIFEFAEAILEDKPILNGSAKDALKTMELIYKIYCADQQWKKQYNLKCDVPQSLL